MLIRGETYEVEQVYETDINAGIHAIDTDKSLLDVPVQYEP